MRTSLKALDGHDYDVAVIGAGINGAVSAAALSAAGLNVLIIDKGDFASFTSQQSSNMVWGGIKYLQSLEFGLVFKLCLSRAKLMRNYPSRIKQIGFLAAIGDEAPANLLAIWAGAWLYWVIGLFSTRTPKVRDVARSVKYEPSLKDRAIGGTVQYFDGLLLDNDARFVWDFVSKAKSFGAEALNYTTLTSANRGVSNWELHIRDESDGATAAVYAKAVVNASGPFASGLNELLDADAGAHLVLSKGIHLVVPKLTTDDRVLAFWDEEGRLFYVLPMHDRSVIGTTDTRVNQPETEVTDEDRDFVIRQINKSMNLARPLTRADIIAERSGVRPLVAANARQKKNSDVVDWHKMSRKHVIAADSNKQVVSIFGGKLTDCLNVGQEIIDEFRAFGFELNPKKWFGEPVLNKKAQTEILTALTAQIRVKSGDAVWSQQLAHGLYRRHGVQAAMIVGESNAKDLTPIFEGLDYCAAELKHILANEMVMTQQDLLRRRTPLALIRSASEIAANTRLQEVLSGLPAH
jgi:glycerol-3-phosphate dehydrogenase